VQRSPLSLRIGGTTYKVHATAPEGEMRRLAEAVDEKLSQINPHNRPVTPQMFLLVALSFAHEAQQERERRRDVEVEARQMLETIVARIDAALLDAVNAEDEGPSSP
jgi:cell division protein ZapA (FtsZ GTPase activity inhibitor)